MPVLCEECKTNEASYTISVMVGGEITTRHLCGDCMAKMNMDIASGNIKSLLSYYPPLRGILPRGAPKRT